MTTELDQQTLRRLWGVIGAEHVRPQRFPSGKATSADLLRQEIGGSNPLAPTMTSFPSFQIYN